MAKKTKTVNADATVMQVPKANVTVAPPVNATPASGNVIDTTATQAGNNSVTPNSQTGGTGDANINPYNNAYEAYQTAMNKVKTAQIGQADTEYNNQQKQIQGNYQNLGRNAYVTYMQKSRQGTQAASNMGASRTGMAENMQTANAVDYNRSVGNVGAYRQNQLSNAENAYNSQVAGINNTYDTNMANAANEYRQLEIARQNELADQQTQMDFEASENAKNREQQALEAERAYKLQEQQFQDTKYKNSFDNWSATIGRYTSTKSVDKAIKKLKAAKKNGKLTGWKKEYYSDMMSYLRAQRATVKKKK